MVDPGETRRLGNPVDLHVHREAHLNAPVARAGEEEAHPGVGALLAVEDRLALVDAGRDAGELLADIQRQAGRYELPGATWVVGDLAVAPRVHADARAHIGHARQPAGDGRHRLPRGVAGVIGARQAERSPGQRGQLDRLGIARRFGQEQGVLIGRHRLAGAARILLLQGGRRSGRGAASVGVAAVAVGRTRLEVHGPDVTIGGVAEEAVVRERVVQDMDPGLVEDARGRESGSLPCRAAHCRGRAPRSAPRRRCSQSGCS